MRQIVLGFFALLITTAGLTQNTNLFPDNDQLIPHQPMEMKTMVNDTMFCYNWISQTEEWELRSITINDYDEAGRLIEMIAKFYDPEEMVYTPVTREIYSFNSIDSLEYETAQLWNTELNGGSYDNIQRTYYEYDVAGFLQYQKSWFSSYGDTTWRNGNQEFHSYNEYDLKDTTLTMYWNTNFNDWFYSYRMRYYYDEMQELSEYYSDFANNQTGEYTMNDRKLYVFNETENEMEIIDQSYWDGVWSNYSRELNSYNLYDQKISSLWQQWNPIDIMWDTAVMQRTLFVYTDEGLLDQFINQSYYIMWANSNRYLYEYENGIPVSFLSQGWNHSNEQWINSQLCLYPLPQVITAVDENIENSKEIQVYPNPAKDYIILTMDIDSKATISLLNITGQTVLKQEAENLNEYNLSLEGLKSGIYLLNVETQNISVSKTISIKQ